MKIEKINDNQIRCTLTKDDLAKRQIKFSELAYGTEKAKSLFRDMMLQAANEFGFEANDIPLMIEAIPLSAESIILIITKVEDPEELDTRFAKFSPSGSDDDSLGQHPFDGDSPIASKMEGADDILGLFNKLREARKKIADKKSNSEDTDELEEVNETPFNLTRLYKFSDLDSVIRVAHVLTDLYGGHNSLYKENMSGQYHLIISKSEHSPEEFNKICNILSEYGMNQKFSASREAFYAEHMECIIAEGALQKLAQV